MMKSTHYIYYVLATLLITISACQDKNRNAILRLVEEWQGKEITFPDNCVFTILAKDTVEVDLHTPTYKILMYVDSTGCTGCRLQLSQWSKFITEVDSLTNGETPFLFFLSPKSIKDARYTLRKDDFTYPVCIDIQNQLNKVNNFPAHDMFQTFLLDKDNKVVVIGNPIHNRAIRSLYIKELTGKEGKKSINTTVNAPITQVNLGTLTMEEEKSTSFTITNVGHQPLVIYDVVASCGCTKVDYDKKPVSPNKKTTIEVVYTAEKKGAFDKTITVHCNAAKSPLKFKIKGNVDSTTMD